MTKILATSDTHGHLPDIPDCDILIHAGDICPMDNHGIKHQREYLDTAVRAWLNKLEKRGIRVVMTPGNHDFVFEDDYLVSSLHLPWTVLVDAGFMIKGIHFYGTPWTPRLESWAFYADDTVLERMAEEVPKCDILIAHSPPFGYGDRVSQWRGGHEVGNEFLPLHRAKAVACGHIHEGYGLYKYTGTNTDIYNVAYLDDTYAVRGDIVEIIL